MSGPRTRTCGVLCHQGKEPSVRQLALLHFRDTITLSVKLEDALTRTHARVPAAIVQMLLVLQVGGSEEAAAYPCQGPPRECGHKARLGQMLRLETGSPEEGSEMRIWGHVTSQWGYCRESEAGGDGEMDEDVGSGGGWPQPGPTGARECELDQSWSSWAGLGLCAPRPSVVGAVGRLPPRPTVVPDISGADGFCPRGQLRAGLLRAFCSHTPSGGG